MPALQRKASDRQAACLGGAITDMCNFVYNVVRTEKVFHHQPGPDQKIMEVIAMAFKIISLCLFALLAGCGGANGGGSTTGTIPPPDASPQGTFTGHVFQAPLPPIQVTMEITGTEVKFFTAGTGYQTGTLNGNFLDGVWDFHNTIVNVSKNRIWLDGRIDVRGGE